MSPSSGFSEERAKGYDDRIGRHIPGYDVLHGLTETILGAELSPEAAILVGGVGTGAEIFALAPKHPHWQFLGVDPSEAMIGIAKAKGSAGTLEGHAQLQVGTVETLPEDVIYDAATLLLVLHFIPDQGEKEALLSAIADRLKPGAPLVLASMFGDPASTRHKRLMVLTKNWAIAHGMEVQKAEELCNPERTDLFVVPEERLKILLRNAGFIDIQRVYQAFSIGMWLARMPR